MTKHTCTTRCSVQTHSSVQVPCFFPFPFSFHCPSASCARTSARKKESESKEHRFNWIFAIFFWCHSRSSSPCTIAGALYSLWFLCTRRPVRHYSFSPSLFSSTDRCRRLYFSSHFFSRAVSYFPFLVFVATLTIGHLSRCSSVPFLNWVQHERKMEENEYTTETQTHQRHGEEKWVRKNGENEKGQEVWSRGEGDGERSVGEKITEKKRN